MTDDRTLLIVDDDSANLDSYAMGFARQPYRLLTAQGGRKALEMLREENIDVVLTDLKMPEVDGLEVARAALALPVPPVVIVVTAYGTIESSVEAMREGAFDYITKPVNLLELRAKVEKAMEKRSLVVANRSLQGLLNTRFRFEGVVGKSKEMEEVIEKARMVADTRASVLIEGESGTGKELIARAIHYNSRRASGPFVPIHCAALPESLLESELFGHEKGAFTGAAQRRIGQFESAQGGTVFLDELAEIPLATQVKLLRVLEQREITRVGSTQAIPIDIRLVGATNKNLAREVEIGRFREDLYYRLNVVRIHIPPLRERPIDVTSLITHYMKELSRENNRPPLKISAKALDHLIAYGWPGNIRELRNTVEQLVIFGQSETVEVDDLPQLIRAAVPEAVAASSLAADADHLAPAALTASEGVGLSPQPRIEEEMSLDDLERRHILQMLERTNQNRTRAAEKLGISRRTLQRKLKEMGLEDQAGSEHSDGSELEGPE